jgi:hypothetical protein
LGAGVYQLSDLIALDLTNHRVALSLGLSLTPFYKPHFLQLPRSL